MKTATVCIGNSDNKLTQQEWHKFIHEINNAVTLYTFATYFNGFSNPDKEFQNGCWVIGINEENIDNFEYHIMLIRKQFKQESIAFVYGDTKLV